jgi:AcrR family transcriptional regulator
MRVDAATKAATRQEILDATRRLLAEKGFEAATTRDIAKAAGIAAGTLFNYFPTKEAVVAELAREALAKADDDFARRDGDSGSLEEDLFAYAAAGLRRLRPLRRHLSPVLETALNPLAGDGENGSLRGEHLETVSRLAIRHGRGEALSTVALQLYWTLYTGVLAYWAQDASAKQEDTLALLDSSLTMFVGWLEDKHSEQTES